MSEMDFVLEDARIDSSLPTALPERGEAHEVDLVAETKVSHAFVECGDRVVNLAFEGILPLLQHQLSKMRV